MCIRDRQKYIGEKDPRNPVEFIREFEQLTDVVEDNIPRDYWERKARQEEEELGNGCGWICGGVVTDAERPRMPFRLQAARDNKFDDTVDLEQYEQRYSWSGLHPEEPKTVDLVCVRIPTEKQYPRSDPISLGIGVDLLADGGVGYRYMPIVKVVKSFKFVPATDSSFYYFSKGMLLSLIHISEPTRPY